MTLFIVLFQPCGEPFPCGHHHCEKVDHMTFLSFGLLLSYDVVFSFRSVILAHVVIAPSPVWGPAPVGRPVSLFSLPHFSPVYIHNLPLSSPPLLFPPLPFPLLPSSPLLSSPPLPPSEHSLPCTEDIPTCGDTCNKVSICVQISFHSKWIGQVPFWYSILSFCYPRICHVAGTSVWTSVTMATVARYAALQHLVNSDAVFLRPLHVHAQQSDPQCPFIPINAHHYIIICNADSCFAVFTDVSEAVSLW